MKLLTLFHFGGIQPDINSGQHSMDPFSHLCFFMQYFLGSKNTLWKLRLAKYTVLINKNKVKTHTPCPWLYLEGTCVLFNCPWLRESSVEVANNCCYLWIGGSMVSTSCCLTSPSPSSGGPVSCSIHWRTRRHTPSTCLQIGAASFWRASLLPSDSEEYCVLEHQGMVRFICVLLAALRYPYKTFYEVVLYCAEWGVSSGCKRTWKVWPLRGFAAHSPFERRLVVGWMLSDLRMKCFMLDFSVKVLPFKKYL